MDDERAARAERRLELPVLVAALLVVPVIVIEESRFGEPWDTIGVVLNWASWLMFLAEAVVMLSVVRDRRTWLRQHPIEVAVVVLTPPFLAALAPVRLLRLLRLLRLVRLARLARRLFSAEGLRYAALLATLTTLVGGAAYTELEEGQSTAEGMYWALTTITTVGYGDLSPVTTGGRFLAGAVMLVGIGFIAILTGAVAERFLAAGVQREAEEVEQELDTTSAEVIRHLRELGRRLDEVEALVRAQR
jgi:voltage-gated potassium channel